MIQEEGQEPLIDVGLLLASEVQIELKGVYYCEEEQYSELLKIHIQDQQICMNGKRWFSEQEQILFISEPKSSFVVRNVMFGINFHWERYEDLEFSGHFMLKKEGSNVRLINRVGIESYLSSVISSEMSATASSALLKAHAIMSRSWLLAQLKSAGRKKSRIKPLSGDELVRWYDREDHHGFDVCADDHCQRYQGLSRITSDKVQKAINATRGLVLTSGGKVCDARFSKCCGGITERFAACWDDVDPTYLRAVRDDHENLDATVSSEELARDWILSVPDVFCATYDPEILSQVLNAYDRETANFFRWEVSISAAQIKRNLKEKNDLDIGDINNLIPIERGASGRIVKLKLVGSKRSIIVGKELEIRRLLSDTHLLSSAFVVKKNVYKHELNFILKGAGWGHGVGLCQIGAAVMGAKGYSFSEILRHYFKNTKLESIY